jgi:hypothetical protein
MRDGSTQARHRGAASRGEAGLGLLEVVVALGILLVVSLGILPLGLIAISTTENQGHLAARTTEYSQDKMEQLLTLAYNDAVTDTRVFPSAATGGTGLAVGGSADPAAPVTGYADYLDVDGNVLAAGLGVPAGWFYCRAWQISSPSANMKQISVTTIVAHAYSLGRTPQSTLSALKSFPF